MSDRENLIHFKDDKWSAAYADRPEESFDGVAMQDAIDRLRNTRLSGNTDCTPELENTRR